MALTSVRLPSQSQLFLKRKDFAAERELSLNAAIVLDDQEAVSFGPGWGGVTGIAVFSISYGNT